jgi:5-methyltetrahydrofolate--homocysteine methyltransferase
MIKVQPYLDAICTGNKDNVEGLIKKALSEGVSASEILNRGLLSAMDVIGERMANEEMFIPEVLLAAKTMAAGLEILKPAMSDTDSKARGRVVIGTVKGDLHDIGKNLVAMMLQSTGLEVHNVGVDVPPERFIEILKEKDAHILALSSLLTTTMPMMRKTVEAVVEGGFRNQVKIIVGGAPVTQEFSDEIGADGFAPDAGSAVKLVKSLL